MSTSTTPPNAPEFSDQELKTLHDEKFIAEVLNARKGPPEKAKHAWQIFLESSGGAALITVLLGVGLGSYFTNSYQSRQAAIVRAQAAREKLQELRFQVTADSLTLVSATVAATEDLLQLPTPAFLEASDKQRNAIRATFIDADANWRKQNENVVGFKLNYYFRAEPNVIQAWTSVRAAVTAYDDCASAWIESHPKYTDGLPVGCKSERDAVGKNLEALQNALPALGE
jgi:hypothetical protein